MIDHSTQEPLTVRTAEDAGPYIMIPVSQLDDVCRLLDAHGIKYWVDEIAISIDDEPESTVINLGRDVDPAKVQQLLDAAA